MREINEELLDVWAEMLGEKINNTQEKLMCETDIDEIRRLNAYIHGLTESMALLSCLEHGRFKQKYDEITKRFSLENKEK